MAHNQLEYSWQSLTPFLVILTACPYPSDNYRLSVIVLYSPSCSTTDCYAISYYTTGCRITCCCNTGCIITDRCQAIVEQDVVEEGVVLQTRQNW
jgi:hypothetical protein